MAPKPLLVFSTTTSQGKMTPKAMAFVVGRQTQQRSAKVKVFKAVLPPYPDTPSFVGVFTNNIFPPTTSQ